MKENVKIYTRRFEYEKENDYIWKKTFRYIQGDVDITRKKMSTYIWRNMLRYIQEDVDIKGICKCTKENV